jgi:hypothetical protein
VAEDQVAKRARDGLALAELAGAIEAARGAVAQAVGIAQRCGAPVTMDWLAQQCSALAAEHATVARQAQLLLTFALPPAGGPDRG